MCFSNHAHLNHLTHGLRVQSLASHIAFSTGVLFTRYVAWLPCFCFEGSDAGDKFSISCKMNDSANAVYMFFGSCLFTFSNK